MGSTSSKHAAKVAYFSSATAELIIVTTLKPFDYHNIISNKLEDTKVVMMIQYVLHNLHKEAMKHNAQQTMNIICMLHNEVQ